MNARRFSIVLLAVMLALALVGAVSAKGANPAPANQMVLHGQEIHQGILMVDSVTAAQDGWIVVYKRPTLTSDMIVGYAPVKQGLNQNVRVALDDQRIKDVSTLWARLHVDNKPVGVFEWGFNNRPLHDAPVVQDGKEVVTAFGTSGDSAPLALAPAITIKSHDPRQGPLIVDAVTTPVDGWLVIYRDQTFTPGAVLGYAPVYQGTNIGVKVAIESDRVHKDQPTLWAMLHTDQGEHGVFDWGKKATSLADTPLIYQGRPVIASFGTTAP